MTVSRRGAGLRELASLCFQPQVELQPAGRREFALLITLAYTVSLTCFSFLNYLPRLPLHQGAGQTLQLKTSLALTYSIRVLLYKQEPSLLTILPPTLSQGLECRIQSITIELRTEQAFVVVTWDVNSSINRCMEICHLNLVHW